MSHLLSFALVLGLSPCAQETLSDEEVKVAVSELDQALDGKDEDAQIDAIHAVVDLVHPDVIRRLDDELRSRSRAVKSAAITALGHMKHKDALKALHRSYEGDQELREDEGLFVTLLTAIGRHGDESSVSHLLDKPFDELTLETGRARIFALANIRCRASLEGLIKAMSKGGPSRRVKGEVEYPFMPFFRTALTVLTGADQGATKEAWQEWWRENDNKLKVSPEPPPVYAHTRRQWEEFWGEPYSTKGSATSPAKGNPAPQFQPITHPTEEQVAAALAELETAWKENDELVQTVAIEQSSRLIDSRVIESIAKGCKARSPAVAVAAIDALGWMRHQDSLKVLHELYQKSANVRNDDYLLPRLLKSVGRHCDPSSIPILADKRFKNDSRSAIIARIAGLARIRHKDSVAAFMKAMREGPSGVSRGRLGPAGSAPPYMSEVSLALRILTGEDLGTSKQAWQDWWKDHEKTFEVLDQPPPLSDPIRETLEEYWGESYGQP